MTPLYREQNPRTLGLWLNKWPELTAGFPVREWLTNDANVAITDGKGNYALFVFETEKVYTAHVFFGSAKGKDALALGKEMLAKFFKDYPVSVLRGLTPVERLPARWFANKLGFEALGEVETAFGWCELFMLTRDKFLQPEEA